MPTWFVIALCCLGLYGAFAVWAQVRFHSYRYGLNYLAGARLQMHPPLKPVGSHRVGDATDTVVTLWNHGAAPVRVVGALAECSCTARRGVPATIPGGGSVDLPISIRFGTPVGDWRSTVRFLTDDPHDPEIAVTLQAEVVADPGANTAQPTLGGRR